jgi:tetratricopeptide (TPR) repeat protein
MKLYQKTGFCLLFLCSAAQAGQQSWDEWIRRSDQLCRERKFAEAESYLSGALKAADAFAPSDIRLSETQHRLGTVYRELGRLPEAEKWYQRSLSTLKVSAGENSAVLPKPLISLASLSGGRSALEG